MPYDIDPRLLRAFLAVAEELHFTRAAARLYVAQQALSRDIRRLERELGTALFVRTTRQVSLTADGTRLLPLARQVLTAHDELAGAFRAAPERPLLVDVGVPIGTAHGVLEAARGRVPDSCELVARFHSGLTGAASEVAAGRLDVSFGRIAALPPGTRAGLDHQPVRLEPMAVLLREDHPLAARPAVALADLAGETLYAAAGNPRTAEWTDLAERLFAGRGIAAAEPFPEIEGSQEFVRVVRKRGWSVLASVEFIEVPGMVLRPLVDPVPLSPVSMVWRRGLRHPGLDALRAAARELGGRHGWLAPPGSAWWLPEEDARVMGVRG
ncbi:DNA-binding transcriptional regulator, LysR family [Streptomyces sp. 2224.1]|uniref:LysR family transcriptional regulator n=1 Tax=unclassified Streptomyces TaxID=2593676 RepID=UPI00087ED16E|nr:MULTISPECIES: LysR family transcriptional regulator [unclassified Streptomyces]PBC82700.1 DNA-binding transcriptional LysR family regulator [Streptomyces sp. 2321.6]SDR47860.1 DNA-binding transcriptional regulator, LysR family [Streptomyces sp. KS_16]SEC36651.1 DNA-binding transcriptional regulator, LysR family [Streptomyces sp. 2224.1]SEC68262.1 DNA-binding transcriptional regulator, LysR family [Streptomyces sp. 2133.1]SEE93629.1 DNA-binding transcriptional regulator, LysR family [Strepto